MKYLLRAGVLIMCWLILWDTIDQHNWYAAGITFALIVTFGRLTATEDERDTALRIMVQMHDELQAAAGVKPPLDTNDPQ